MNVHVAPAVERVLTALETFGSDHAARRNGEGWKARCVCHDERTASLSINEGPDGRALLHCFGCKANGQQVCDRLGVSSAILAPDYEPNGGPPAIPRTAASREPEPLPSERDLDRWRAGLLGNEALLQRIQKARGWSRATLERLGVGWNSDTEGRFAGPRFRERLVLPARNANGDLAQTYFYLPPGKRRDSERDARKVNLIAGRGRPPFPAPESVPSDDLFVFEGEGDAISAHEIGVPAIGVGGTSGGGVRSWAQRVQSRELRICFDASEGARKAAGRLSLELEPLANSVKVIDLAPERNDGYDLTALLVEKGPEAAAARLVERVENAARPTLKKLRRLDVSAMLDSSPPPVPWVVDNFAARGMVTMLAGRGGVAKSLLSQSLAAGIARGGSEAGLDCRTGSVAFFDLENGAAEIHRRMHGLGWPRSGIDVYEVIGLNLHDEADVAEIDSEVGWRRPSLVVIDSFRSSWQGDENESDGVTRVLMPLVELARKHDTAVLLLHHVPKGGADYRGSSAIEAVIQFGFTLARADRDPDNHRRLLRCWKCRSGPEPDDHWFRIDLADGRLSLTEAEPYEEAQSEPVQRNLVAEKLLLAHDAHPKLDPGRGRTRDRGEP